MSRQLLLGAVLALCPAALFAQDIEMERVTERGGYIDVCGVGEGMAPCRDSNGETYEEETQGRDVQLEGSGELAEQAARIRSESPEELEETIRELEQGEGP